MRMKNIYGFCIVGMIILVIISLFLPQMLFAIQDEYRIGNTETAERSNFDIAQWNASYEQNLNTRLSKLLNMRGTTVTAIEHEFVNDSEMEELIESFFYQSWFVALYDNDVMTTYVLTGDFKEAVPLAVQECKKYLVHGSDYQDGVALMMWYVDLYLAPVDIRVRLLVDTETNTIYYVKVTGGDNRRIEEYKVDKVQVERLYYWADSIPYFFQFYYDYYEADANALFNEYGTYDEASPWFVDAKIEEEYCEVVFPLCYGVLSTDFLVRAELGNGDYPDFTMGLPLIGELIPEMLQD